MEQSSDLPLNPRKETLEKNYFVVVEALRISSKMISSSSGKVRGELISESFFLIL